MEASGTYLCLFDLPPYDHKVAPALRRYAHQFDPSGVTALLHEAAPLEPGREDDFKHWADSVGPDAGYKPSEQTIRDLCDMLIPVFCVKEKLDLDRFAPWLSGRSEWFADLMQGGEELAGGRLEFSFGSGSLIATRQQIRQFLNEVRRVADAPEELRSDYEKLRRVLETADGNTRYTLLKTQLRR